MACDESLAARVRGVLSPAAGLAEKKMFGGLCFLIHGNMCCGVLKEELVLRLEPERAQEVLRRPHTRPMDFTGRPLKGFVYVEAPALRTGRHLRGWVTMALAFARSLPPKAGRAPAKKPAQTRRVTSPASAPRSTRARRAARGSPRGTASRG